MEIKKTASPGKNDVRHFQTLEKLKLPIGPGGLICLAGQSKTNQIDGLGNRQLGQVHNFGNSVLYQSPKSDDHKEAIGISGC
jgi:hypothetical protein